MKILLRVSIILVAAWVLITNTVKAEETPKYPEMYGTQLPAICGPTDVVRKLVDDLNEQYYARPKRDDLISVKRAEEDINTRKNQ